MSEKKILNNRALLKKTDLYLILFLLIISLVIYFIYNIFSSKENLVAEIYIEKTLVKTVSLDKDMIFALDESEDITNNITFEIKNHEIAFHSSDCPDKICIHTGFLSHSGQTAVCLPNKVTLKLVSSDSKDNELDSIAR